MKTKLMITGMSVTILALATPVYAGHLGGGLGGGLGGTIGNGFGAGGGFASHGGLNDSVNATDARELRQSADKANAKTGTVAKSAAAPAAAKSSSAPAPAKTASTAASAPRSKPAASTNLTGASDETLHAGGREVSSSGTGSVGADHSPGSNSVEASATTSGSQH
jgi:hypothetical protein